MRDGRGRGVSSLAAVRLMRKTMQCFKGSKERTPNPASAVNGWKVLDRSEWSPKGAMGEEKGSLGQFQISPVVDEVDCGDVY